MAKVSDVDGLSPRTMQGDSEDGGSTAKESTEGVRLKKELSLTNGVAIIVGVIVGSGIFVSPNLALRNSGSKGMSLIVWILSGLLSMIGALCYAELGTMIPKSGGDYAYIGEAFGPLPSFLYLWGALFILVPTGNAITAFTFAQNILQPLWHDCPPPLDAVRLIAAVITCLITAINCFNVKWVTRVQDSFTAAKMLALLVTFCASLWYLCSHGTQNLQSMMTGTNLSPGGLATAFYSGLFSYSGWNYLNFVTEELQNPYKNLPRAICISMPVVTLVYALTNLAFFAVLNNSEILVTEAVAVTFSDKILRPVEWIMPIFVAMCTFGSLNGAIYTSSRLFFVGARNGHLPMAISLIDIKRLTPVPSLIFMCVVTLILLLFNSIQSLIVCVTAVESLFIIFSLTGLMWLRYKRPDMVRPIRVNLLLPIIFFIVSAFLVVFAIYDNPVEVTSGIAFIILGVPVYYVFIHWQSRPQWLKNSCNNFNVLCSKMFLCLPEDSKEI